VTLKIENIVLNRRTTVRLIGRVQADDLPEVVRQLEASGPGVVLQMDEVMLVDVEVVRFLNKCETEGVRLVNCSPYIREWMSRERNRSQGSGNWRLVVVPRAISRAPLTQEPGEQVFDTWSHGGLDHAA
jgi:hypothetical protein